MEKKEQLLCLPGLVSVSFRSHEPEEILAGMKKAGLCFIEWGSDVHAPKEDRENLEKLAQLQKQYDVRCCSYGTYFRLGVTEMEELDSYIDAAQILGTDVLRLWCGDKDSEKYSPEERKRLFEICRAAAQKARQQQVTLCMECHNNTFTNTRESALDLMKAVNSPYFKMYWQPNQFRTESENCAYAGLLADHTEHLHVFNWKGDQKFPLKDAVLVWKKYLAQFTGKHYLLLEFMPDDRLESLGEEAKALKEIIKQDRRLQQYD